MTARAHDWGQRLFTRRVMLLLAFAAAQCLSIAAVLALTRPHVDAKPAPQPLPAYLTQAERASWLLDAYDRGGKAGDLYEAMQWVDRDWYSDDAAQVRVVARVYDRYCDLDALRWHLLCNTGE